MKERLSPALPKSREERDWRGAATATWPGVKTRGNAASVAEIYMAGKWKVPEVQLRRLATRRREASMARTAIASADEANGWLKPEKTEEERGRGKRPRERP